MQWVLLVVMVVALLYLSRFYPKVAFSVLGTLVLAAAGDCVYDYRRCSNETGKVAGRQY